MKSEKIDRYEMPLRASYRNSVLVIEIGIGTLAFAAENCDDNPKCKVTNARLLAEDVIQELNTQDEVGSSMLTDLFDKAVTAAFDNGSCAIDHEQKVAER